MSAFSLAADLLDPPASQYLHNPVGFAQDTFGFEPWSKQQHILQALRDHDKVAVRSSHGIGKTAIAAQAALWFLGVHPNSRVITTAPTWTQVEQLLWRAIRGQVAKAHQTGRGEMFPRPHTTKLELGPEWFALGQSTDQPERFQGHHAEHLLLVVDEASGVAESIFEAAEGFLTAEGAKVLLIGNPNSLGGQFYRCFTSESARWEQIHVSTFDTPNYTGEHVAADVARALPRAGWAEEMAQAWGEDSPVYQVRVLGNFPTNAADSVIPLAWVDLAQQRWRDTDLSTLGHLKTIGVDVARSGTDRTVLAVRHDLTVTRLERLPQQGTMDTTGRVVAALRAMSPNPLEAPTAIVDVIGIGAGVVDRLREQQAGVVAFNASKRSDRLDKTGQLGFVNCLLGSDRVRPVGDLVRVYRAPYEGPLLKIKTAGGDEFTATPNHQVLTHRGWAAVQAVHVGDKLCDTARRDVSSATVVGPEVDDVPPTLGQLYAAADRLFGSERVKAHAVNFHGDRPVGEVEVVAIDRQLLSIGPPIGQQRKDFALVRSLVGLGRLTCERPLAQSVRERHRRARIRPTFPDHCVPSGALLSLGQREAIMGGAVRFRERAKDHAPLNERAAHYALADAELVPQRLHRLAGRVATNDRVRIKQLGSSEPHGLGFSPWLDAVLVQDTARHAPLDPVALGERVQRLASEIPGDEIVSVEVLPTSGHFVYTLETSTGCYGSSRTLHRNCRAAAWWNLREMLDPDGGVEIALPPDDRLTGDLTAPKWRVMSGGKIQIESKDDIRKRLGRSTDDGDAVVQAFWPEGGVSSTLDRFAHDQGSSFFGARPQGSRWTID